MMLDLFEHWEERKHMGYAAYQTIVREWNAAHAAEELIRFARDLAGGKTTPSASGPLSPAPAVFPGKMYGAMMRGEI